MDDRDFIILNGSKKIIFSAPHAVEQIRNGKIKYAEPDTAEIAKQLNLLGFPCIIKTKNNSDDANFDKKSIYKEALREYVEKENIMALIDLHEMSQTREQTICLGTGGDNCLNLLGNYYVEQKLQAYFSKYFENVAINDPFKASYPYTVSRYISKVCNIPCIQVEINCNLFIEHIMSAKEIAKILDNAANILMERENEKNIISKQSKFKPR